MLTLDCSTLFYWNLITSNRFASSIDSWAKAVPTNTTPLSQAPSRAVTTVSSLTNASSCSTGHSVLTDSITDEGAPAIRRVKSEPDVVDHGGLSDHDEVSGLERDAAVKSPPKGKKRVHSEGSSFFNLIVYQFNHIIQQDLVVEAKPKIEKATGESSTIKRFKNGDLPNGIDFKVWRRVFVPTFMRWVSQQDNPFEHNPKIGCNVMQRIWDSVFSDVPCTITQSSAVYALVSHNFYT
jgi:hypothetical protein